MFDEVNKAIDEYLAKWQALVGQRKNKEFFDRLKLMAVGWKTTDQAEFDRLLNEWRGACDQIHMGWKNDRWLATLHLKDGQLSGGIKLVKLMQRRPGSSDAVGLDHLDFMDMEETNTIAVLAEESDLKTTEEENGRCKWTSIWFDGTEAKLRGETVLDVCIDELKVVNNNLRGDKFKKPGDQPVGLADVE